MSNYLNWDETGTYTTSTKASAREDIVSNLWDALTGGTLKESDLEKLGITKNADGKYVYKGTVLNDRDQLLSAFTDRDIEEAWAAGAIGADFYAEQVRA